MAHPEQIEFCKQVKKRHPQFFKGKTVIDVGSLDINGNNRYLFQSFYNPCKYLGIDIVPGKNVDLVAPAHEALNPYMGYIKFTPDVIISTECLEHDEYWRDTIAAMYGVLKSGGLLLITAAGEGREEHGTKKIDPWCSPGTNDYYQNITTEMLSEVLKPEMFTEFFIGRNEKAKDIYCYGIKK